VKYRFHLRNTITGETGVYEDSCDYADLGLLLYQWADGNYGCDCNRSLFLYGDDETKHLPCGDDVIALDRIVGEDGSEIDPASYQ
jgi:hypothetical protein